GLRLEADDGATAAPSPFERVVDEPCANRIQVVVPDALQQVSVALDQPRVESPLEDVPGQAVMRVEKLAVQPVQPLHPAREVGPRSPNEEMEVVGHLDIAEDLPFGLERHPVQPLEKEDPVVRVQVDRLPSVPSAGDVVDRAGGVDTRRARHRPTLATPATGAWRCSAFVAKSARSRHGRGQTPAMSDRDGAALAHGSAPLRRARFAGLYGFGEYTA